MRPHARKPVTRRTKPSWTRSVAPDVEAEPSGTDEVATTGVATPRVALSRASALRDQAAVRVGAVPKRTVETRADPRSVARPARTAAVRTGPSLLDHAAANIGYIRTDLARIAVLACVMVGTIVALSFILA